MCVARVRRTPVSDASVDVRRARDETDSSRDGRLRDAPRVVRMEVRGALEIRRRACVTGRRSRRWVSSHHALFVRSVGPPARPSNSASRRARDARGRRSSRRPSRDSHFPRARARRARRALALVVLPSSDPGRSWRWKYPRERGAWRGFPSRKARRGERSRASGTKSIALSTSIAFLDTKR